MTDAFDTLLQWKLPGQATIGRDRIAMLDAVAQHGSLTQAARFLGISYKSVWDGITAINNLLPRPALRTQAGGRGGGGAILTEEGRRLIDGFRQLEAHFARLSQALTDTETLTDLPFWSLAMQTSARNSFHCIVRTVTRAPVNVEIGLDLGEGQKISAVITNDSTDALNLVPGREVVALIKSSFILLARGEDPPAISARNMMRGVVADRRDGGVNSEILLDLGHGKILTTVITRDSANQLGLQTGDNAWALFKASHVILAAL